MTKSTITREQLEEWVAQFDEDGGCDATDRQLEALIRQSLAEIDSEPVAWTWHYREQWHVTNDKCRAEFVATDGDVAVLPLYRHAQSAQISEPVLPLQDKDLQGVIDALEHPAGINAAGKQVVRHALVEIQERRKADREPVAEVVSIYGDPEAFGEREIRPLVGIQQMPYGTKLYRHAQPAPVVPDDVLAALQKVARIRLDLNDFDGDRRGIADCLGDAEEALIEVVNRRAAMLHACNSPANPDCWCRTCRPVVLNDMRFVVCPDCGNKRCPRANDHRNACTGSNEPGQEGSAYPADPQSPGSEPATVPGKWIPVSERMPIEFEAVIAFDGDQVYGEAMYSSDDGFTIDGYEPCDRLNLQNVTHWMPLPAAPREVNRE